MFPNNNQNKNSPSGGGGSGGGNQPPRMPDWQRWVWPIVLLLLLGWTLFRIPDMVGMVQGAVVEIPYNVLRDQAEDNNIASIKVIDQQAEGTFRRQVTFADPVTGQSYERVERFRTTLLPGASNDALFEALNASDADMLAAEPDPNVFLIFLVQVAPLLLVIGFLVWMARRTQRQMGGAFNFGRTQAREYTVDRPQVKFDDVAGQDAAKGELTEVVDFLREPDKYIALGARIPRGVLLVGPPGTGKTLLARAVAGEASVSFFSIAASEFVEMFVGVGASRVRDLFKRAKDNAPSIVFIDEIDAVGRQRGAGLGGGHDEREQTLNQMLAEMDGFDQNESVIVLAATNRPDVLDPALLRPGRFDRQITVGLPDRKGRESILKIHTRGKPLDSTVVIEDLARSTIGFSGADLSNLANEAALTAARRNARKVGMRDFLDAFDRIVLGTESPPLSNEAERRVIAFHEAGHALVAALTPDADPILKTTIVPRGRSLGVMVSMPDDDRRNYSKRYIEARLLVALGGRAAEQVIFKEPTTGAESDLRTVTDMARRMVAQWGMSDAIGTLNFGDHDRQPFLGYSLAQDRSYSEETAAKIDAEVRRIVDAAYEKTIRLLADNREKLEALAEALLTHEILSRDEVFTVIGVAQPESELNNIFQDVRRGDIGRDMITAPAPHGNGGNAGGNGKTEEDSPAPETHVAPEPSGGED